ncbi:hypothetical protein MAHJHV61_39640 [Mycobacterium avium subsp. hominissuis]|uniref:hypothetical protein n=1 Tax=Mycobacterium avium TaxID=1764 RepID=UPI0009FEBCC4|nr:hypothetical protein [Mycobacterium avium]MBZ4631365.1 hypothetical protein [Mycobacterium avium subsp. hominissuis]
MKLVTIVVEETAVYVKRGIEVPDDVDFSDAHTMWELWAEHGGTDRDDLDGVIEAEISVDIERGNGIRRGDETG